VAIAELIKYLLEGRMGSGLPTATWRTGKDFSSLCGVDILDDIGDLV
jgi:hypothetical protein